MLLIIDHYDSFSNMIADYCKVITGEYIMLKTDQISSSTLKEINPSSIIIGPGPGHPSDLELLATKELIKDSIQSQIPILGVCLGHQLIAEIFGAKIVKANNICHGIISKIKHNSSFIFKTLPQSFNVTRYHSLIIEHESLSNTVLKITALTAQNEVMAIQHQSLPIFGVQFHPESVTTDYGKEILENFLNVKFI